ncbi:hypothetical protein J31TS4_14490 [Paenibacillus sp. J31TS4]|uniref:Hsp20/alpha crystallin family protein n=1 Tax=Paenibacillus sp. J31TS4 TaxID=2807195 RepID=UPI001B261FBE|nr:Hsp20/alpha crystallin family protein [Paenibacillus sp. J31TS4]GIP38169.1 hypothetical protein J31TS4_14490 [Paenibacillus sp. J31TS4]
MDIDMGNYPLRGWQELQRSLLKQLPLPAGHGEIDRFVQQTIHGYLRHALPYAHDRHADEEDDLACELFESQQHIYVRCPVPEPLAVRDFRLSVSAGSLRIEFPGAVQEVRLPSPVVPDQAVAHADARGIEVRLPKSREPTVYREIAIRERDGGA